MVLFKFLKDLLVRRMETDWRGQWEDRKTITRSAKVVQVRENDADLGKHLGIDSTR